jgi:hypothetical protein
MATPYQIVGSAIQGLSVGCPGQSMAGKLLGGNTSLKHGTVWSLQRRARLHTSFSREAMPSSYGALHRHGCTIHGHWGHPLPSHGIGGSFGFPVPGAALEGQELYAGDVPSYHEPFSRAHILHVQILANTAKRRTHPPPARSRRIGPRPGRMAVTPIRGRRSRRPPRRWRRR